MEETTTTPENEIANGTAIVTGRTARRRDDGVGMPPANPTENGTEEAAPDPSPVHPLRQPARPRGARMTLRNGNSKKSESEKRRPRLT